jgi:peptidoglycan/LPS O-acetylase OafA/YrhL
MSTATPAPDAAPIATAPGSRPSTYFPHLDGLRFYAFFAVFLFHGIYTSSADLAASDGFRLARSLVANGYLGVNFFFVLSGFLITYLLLHEQKERGRISVPGFYLRRVLRIWPLYFACLFFGFQVYPHLQLVLGREPAATADPFYFILFLSNFFNLHHGLPETPILPILWSVGVEEQFYLFWPLLFVLFARPRYPLLFSGIVLVSLGFRYVHQSDGAMLYYHTLSVISDMAVGGILAYFCFVAPRFTAWLGQMPRRGIATAYIVGAVLVLFRGDIFVGMLIPLERLVLSLVFGFVILEQNYAAHSLFKIGRQHRITRLGRYTYGLYCLHPLGILAGIGVVRVAGMETSLWGVLSIQLTVALLFTMLLAWISYHFLEAPFLLLKNRLSLPPAKPLPTPSGLAAMASAQKPMLP